MLRFSDPAGSVDGSRKRRPTMLPSAFYDSVGTPTHVFTRLNSPACAYPYRRFAAALADGRRTARGHRGSLVLRCRAFSSPSPDRFIPALSIGTGTCSSSWRSRSAAVSSSPPSELAMTSGCIHRFELVTKTCRTLPLPLCQLGARRAPVLHIVRSQSEAKACALGATADLRDVAS